MDTQFLEFWGNLLLSAAKGQRQVDDMSRWMAQGMKGFQDLNAMFLKFYGLEPPDKMDPDLRKTAQASFQNAYTAYLDAMGVVPKSDYTALQKKLEELQKKVSDHEATIRHLRLEISECKLSQGDTVSGFQELIQVQSDQFRELTESFGQFFRGSAADETKKNDS